MTTEEILRDDVDLLGEALSEALDVVESIVSAIDKGDPVAARGLAVNLLEQHGRNAMSAADLRNELAGVRDELNRTTSWLAEAHGEIVKLREAHEETMKMLARARHDLAKAKGQPV